jgi:hypothetical protein
MSSAANTTVPTVEARAEHAHTRWRAHGRYAPDRLWASGYVGAIVVDLILLYCAQHASEWQISWITPAWADVEWAVGLSLQVSIVANAALVVFDARWFRHLVRVVSTGFALLATVSLYAVFPFDFESAMWNEVARLGLMAIGLALAIGIVVTLLLALVEGVRAAMRHIAW